MKRNRDWEKANSARVKANKQAWRRTAKGCSQRAGEYRRALARPERVAAMKAYRQAHPAEARYRAMTLSSRKKGYAPFDMSMDQFIVWFAAQDLTQCQMCPRRMSQGKDAHVDHCHKSGKVRGILCRYCNLILGYMEDEPRKELARRYLERTK